jgi:FkbM family methyltransferase
MAHVSSPIRSMLKPLLFKCLPESAYLRFQVFAKVRDIDNRLVEEIELEVLPSLVEKDAVCIDVGANYAYVTHRLATLAPQGKVYAYEPIPFAYEASSRIVSHFKLDNVELFPLAVGNENNEVTFRVPIDKAGPASVGLSHIASRNNDLPGKERYYKFEQERLIDCKQVRLDDHLLPRLSRLDFVKIDVEGAELFCLQGMKAMLRKFEPVLYVEIYPFYSRGFGIRDEQIQAFFDALGYRFYYYQQSTKKLVPLVGELIPANFILLSAKASRKFAHLIDETGGDGSKPIDLDAVSAA